MASTHTVKKNNQNRYDYPSENALTKNVGLIERWVSAIGGGALAVYGVARRDWPGMGLALIGGGLIVRGTTGHCYVYQALNISTAEKKPNFAPGIPSTISSIPDKKGVRVQRSLTIKRSVEDLYTFWYDIERAPLYMDYIESVMKTSDRTFHWIARGPFGRTVEWNSELLQVVPNEVIAWHVHGKPITANAGKVTFEPAPGSRGTVVTLELDYIQFQGAFGTGIGQIIRHIPEQQTLETLRRFKELMEAGEIPSVKGQPTGKGRK